MWFDMTSFGYAAAQHRKMAKICQARVFHQAHVIARRVATKPRATRQRNLAQPKRPKSAQPKRRVTSRNVGVSWVYKQRCKL